MAKATLQWIDGCCHFCNVILCNLFQQIYIHMHIIMYMNMQTTGKVVEYLKSTIETLVFDILEVVYNQQQTNLIATTCSVTGADNAICSVRNSIYTIDCKGMNFFYPFPKISHNFKDIHNQVPNLWKFRVHSVIRYWHHAKFAIGRWITIWVL